MIKLKNILNKSLLLLPIPFIIHNHIFTIYIDTGNNKNKLNNNNNVEEINKNIHNGGNGSGIAKTYEMITTDNTGKIISTSSSSSKSAITPKKNTDQQFKILLINKFSKKYRHNDVVTLIDPKNPDNTIVRRVLATGNEFLFAEGKVLNSGVPDGCFMYSDCNSLGYPKIVGPIPIGFINGKLLFSIYPLSLSIV